jgi:Flp pilus assembly secretin CpaC
MQLSYTMTYILRMAFLVLGMVLMLSGCGDFFAHKPTELQSRTILQDLSKIETVPDPNLEIPAIYQAPPEILATKRGFKLFYFTRHHTVDKLADLIHQQLGNSVTSNARVNQLIVECQSAYEAQKVLEFIREIDIPPIQVEIDCLVSEIYADVTIDWETTIRIEDLFGEDITLSGKVDENGALLPAFPGASFREPGRNEFGLKVGHSRIDGDNFDALIDLLVSRGYLKILMNPKLKVLNGQEAKIDATDHVPLPVEVITKLGEPYMTTEYAKVVDSLKVTPHVFADGYIGLNTEVVIGSRNTPEGVKQVSIITERMIQNQENRIRQGQSMIIGGIKKVEQRSVVRGVPFLKDIPILGVFFSSKDFEERGKEILFILTPTITNYGIPNREMVEMLREKHTPPIPEPLFNTLGGTVTDLFGKDGEMQKPESDARLDQDPTLEHLSALRDQDRSKQENGSEEKSNTDEESHDNSRRDLHKDTENDEI